MMMLMPQPCTSSATFNIYKETMDCFMFLLWTRSMINGAAMRYDQRWRYAYCHYSYVYIYISLMIMKLWIVLRDYLFSALNCGHWSSNLFWLSRLIIKLRKWFQPATQTLSIFCSKQVLWAGFRFVLLAVWSIMHVISTRHTNAWHKKNTFLSIYIYMKGLFFSL